MYKYQRQPKRVLEGLIESVVEAMDHGGDVDYDQYWGETQSQNGFEIG